MSQPSPQLPSSPTDEAPWSILTSITFHPAEARWQIRAEFSPEANKSRLKGTIITSAWSPLELTTILAALGTGQLQPREESIQEFTSRGGQVQLCPPRFAAGAQHTQSRLRAPLPPVELKKAKSRGKLSEAEVAQLMLSISQVQVKP